MKRAFFAVMAVCGLCALSLLHPLHAQVPSPRAFSADFTNHATPQSTVTGKIYSSPPLLRMDASVNGSESRDSIYSDGKLSYIFWPARHSYREFHEDRETDPTAKAILAEKMFDPEHPCGPFPSCTKQGEETIDGRLCEKWLMVNKKYGSQTTYFDKKLLFPIRRVEASGTVWQLTNIIEAKPDVSIFEVPTGYKKVTPLGGIMSGTRGPGK
jgi:hypothetical protein